MPAEKSVRISDADAKSLKTYAAIRGVTMADALHAAICQFISTADLSPAALSLFPSLPGAAAKMPGKPHDRHPRPSPKAASRRQRSG